jgi:GT2 family glycosyltransferase
VFCFEGVEALIQWNVAKQQAVGMGEEAFGFKKGAGLSVIICTRNRPDEVIRCLNSIVQQSRLPREVIIVDSSDSPVLEARLGAWHDGGTFELRYVRSAPGLPHQRNVGVQESSGDIVFFLDDDVVLERDFIREIKKVFDNDPSGEIGGVMGDILEERQTRQNTRWWQTLLRRCFFLSDYGDGKVRLSGFATRPHGLDEVMTTEFLSGCEMAYRRKVLDEFAFDERLQGYALMEDRDFSYRVSRRYRNVYTPFARCRHLRSPAQRQSQRELDQMLLKNHIYLFRKNSPKTPSHRLAFYLSIVGLKVEPFVQNVARSLVSIIRRVKVQISHGGE